MATDERVVEFDAPLRQQPAQRQRLEVGDHLGALGIGERAELDADISQRGHLGGAERRDFLRRQQLDLLRLHLLLQPEAFAAAAGEQRVDEQREVGEQQQDDDDAHGPAIIHDLPRPGKVPRLKQGSSCYARRSEISPERKRARRGPSANTSAPVLSTPATVPLTLAPSGNSNLTGLP